MTPSVYRSSHPDVLAAWEAAQREYDDYIERRAKQMTAWGFPADAAVYVSNSAFGGPRWLGVEWPKDRDVPTNWRRDRDTPKMIVPRRNSAAGKRIDAEFSKLRRIPTPRARLSHSGMPDSVMRSASGQTYITTYAGTRLGDVVWVRWTVADVEEVDSAFWDQVPLSEFYGLAESGNDPFSPTTEHKP